MISGKNISTSINESLHDFDVAVECCDPEGIDSIFVSFIDVQCLILKHHIHKVSTKLMFMRLSYSPIAQAINRGKAPSYDVLKLRSASI